MALGVTLMMFLCIWFEERVSNIKLTDKFISRYNKPYYRYNGDHDEREFSEFESFTIQPIFVRDKQYRILALMGYLDTEYFGLAEDTDEKAIREVLGRSLRYRNTVPEEQLETAG